MKPFLPTEGYAPRQSSAFYAYREHLFRFEQSEADQSLSRLHFAITGQSRAFLTSIPHYVDPKDQVPVTAEDSARLRELLRTS